MKQSYQKEERCRDERKGSLRHFNVAEKIPSGYLFAEGCDRLVVLLVHPEYCVQICAPKHILDALARRDQLKFATAEGTQQLVELAPVEGRNQGIRAFLPWALWLTRFIKWARRMARSGY